MIPDFNWQDFWTHPWSPRELGTTIPIVVQCFLVSAACGWIGILLIIRKLALVGDAISHSVLPGIVIVAVLFQTLTGPLVMIGAMIAGFVTTLLIEWVHKSSRVKPDAAIGIIFVSMFALGVLMISQLKGSIHLDADCVLFGEISEVAMPGPETIPPQIVQSFIVLLLTIALTLLFYKEIVVSSFDPILATSIGIKAKWLHYGKMAWLSVVVVSAFESVGSVIVVAMLIIPGSFALLLTDRLWKALIISIVHAAISSVLGYHFAMWLNANAPATVVTTGLGLFILAWFFSPHQGIIPIWLARADLRDEMDRSENRREADPTGY
ncbi:MAG: metal ABC transporter permease [Verrucomicrobiales bacterium]|nr:metal ABC transporter permease [Verrucomicrobiales bacterium]